VNYQKKMKNSVELWKYEEELIEIIGKLTKEITEKGLTKVSNYDIISEKDMKMDEIKVKVSVKWSLWDVIKLRLLGIAPDKKPFEVNV